MAQSSKRDSNTTQPNSILEDSNVAQSSKRGSDAVQPSSILEDSDMAQSSNKDTNAELGAVKADLAQLRGDVGDLLKAFRAQGQERARDRASQARDEVQMAFEEGMDTLNRGYRQAREQGKQRVEDAEHLVGNHPLTSVVAAFGIGFVIAKLLDGGRH